MEKTVNLTIRFTPAQKEQLARQAALEGRSITNYIEWLIKRDARRQRKSRKTDAEDE